MPGPGRRQPSSQQLTQRASAPSERRPQQAAAPIQAAVLECSAQRRQAAMELRKQDVLAWRQRRDARRVAEAGVAAGAAH